MTNAMTDINPHIVESLYAEALLLADEVRDAFDLRGRIEEMAPDADLARVALSCEALRTTTRMMHAIAWLLNHRAYLRGELSEFQLRRHGKLPEERSRTDPGNLAMLDPDTRALIVTTERFYARIERLDHAWRNRFDAHPGAVQRLRERLREKLGERFGEMPGEAARRIS